MTIDQAIKDICEKHFPQFSYIFDDWWDVDQAVSRAALPAIAHILPIGGSMRVHPRTGRIYDQDRVYIGFIAKAPRDASGEAQRAVFERMKETAKEFIRIANASGHFQSVTAWNYDVIYNQLASIVTGVMLTLEIEDNGSC